MPRYEPLSIIRAPSPRPEPAMEAERLNQLETTLASLHTRLSELRRFL